MTTIDEFAALVLEQQRARLIRDFEHGAEMAEREEVHVVPGRVYTKVDIGPGFNMSGRYMVENATGRIYGIKGYGKVHKGHFYGTLDTVDEYDWSGYYARRVVSA